MRFRHHASQAAKHPGGTVGDYTTRAAGGKRFRPQFEAFRGRPYNANGAPQGPVSQSWQGICQPCNWRLSNSTSSAIDRSEILSSSILRTACMTVVWSRLPKRLPICGKLSVVSCLARYIAT